MEVGDHTWEGFSAHFWVRILAKGTRGEFFFLERTLAELRRSNRTLWTMDSATHKSNIFGKGISDMKKVSSRF